MEICYVLTLDSAGGIFGGQEAILKVPKKKALISLSSSLCVLPICLFIPQIFFLHPAERKTLPMCWNPLLQHW